MSRSVGGHRTGPRGPEESRVRCTSLGAEGRPLCIATDRDVGRWAASHMAAGANHTAVGTEATLARVSKLLPLTRLSCRPAAASGARCRQVVERPQREQDPRGRCWRAPSTLHPSLLQRLAGGSEGPCRGRLSPIRRRVKEVIGGEQACCVEATPALGPCGQHLLGRRWWARGHGNDRTTALPASWSPPAHWGGRPVGGHSPRECGRC